MTIFSTRESIWAKWFLLTMTGGLYIIWWFAKSYTLTDRYVQVRRGVFGRYSRDIPLGKIQDVTLSTGPLGRILGYGTLRIESAGQKSGVEMLWNVNGASRLRQEIMDQMERLDQRHGA